VSEDFLFAWIRVEPQSGYYPFTGIDGRNGYPYAEDISAEMYCDADTYYYDNMAAILAHNGDTRYCVSFNAPTSGPLSVFANNAGPLTLPNTAFIENYTLSGGNSGNTNCRLLDNNQSPITSYAPCSGSINYNTPNAAGTYGYYVQAYKASANQTATSNQFTVTVNQITANLSVTATNPAPLTLPNTAFIENYTLSGGNSGNTNCRLLDNNQNTQNPLTGYAPCSGSINYNAPNVAGTYAYYVQANKPSTSETVVSNQFVVTVNAIAYTYETPYGYETPTSVSCTTGANPTTINLGSPTTLAWSCTNASSCTQVANADGFSTSGNTSGSDSVTPTATGVAHYSMVCSGTTWYFPDITVISPAVKITANPKRVASGGSSTISWTLTSVSGCSITKNGAAWKNNVNASGNAVETNITSTNTYTISCNSNGTTFTDTVIVVVPAVFHEF
jgi:hypothetical protein